MPGLQPENDGFDSHREHEVFSVWRSLASRVPRAHEIEGSNPSTLTFFGRVGGRMAMQRAVTPPSLLEIHGGWIPSLRVETSAPEVPMADRPPRNRESGRHSLRDGRFDPCAGC